MPSIYYAEAALQDLDEIWRYFAQGSPTRASEFVQELDEVLKLLVDFPYMGRERKEWKEGLRSLNHQKYVIVYSILEEDVVIERVVHGSRDIEGLFRDE
jgi:toxin ParE1/3/4